MFMMANQIEPSLPSHLERAEYLEATGTQYIDLGYPLGYENKVVVDVYSTKQTANNVVLGNESVTSRGYILRIDTGSSLCRFGNSVTSSVAKYRDERQLCTIDYYGVYMNDEFYKWSSPPSDFITDGNVLLFACRNASGAVVYNYKGKFYSCQIYENDVLIHDYIPCFNLESRRPCMYDTTTGIELYNQGTGEFNYHIEGRPIPYLAFEALEDDLQVSITKSATQYSLDRVTWVDLPAEEMTPPIAKGEKVWFRAEITPDGTSTGIGTFSCTKQCNLEGTPMSLLYGDKAGDFLSLPNKQYCFAYLFAYNDKIIRVNNPMSFLPAMYFPSTHCYSNIFAYCHNLVNMPYLPSNNLNANCYSNMFTRCTSLVEILDFPEWHSLGNYCCLSMFSYCTSLVRQPMFICDKIAINCYQSMFAYCSNMKEAQEALTSLSWTNYCYNQMYRGCVSLVKAPDIYAESNAAGTCAAYMFSDCYALKIPPKKVCALKQNIQSFEYMFNGCHNLKISPSLNFAELGNYGGRYMFNNCISLNYITDLSLPIPNSITQSNYQWVNGVAPKGTIVLNKNIEWNPEDYRGANGIPAGWEVKYCDPDNLDDIRDYREVDQPWENLNNE